MSDQEISFNSLDRDAEIEISERNLPHWFQAGAAIFVTFRTLDSLPKALILRMQRELENWLAMKNLPLVLAESSFSQHRPEHPDLLAGLAQPDRHELRRRVNQLYQVSLDQCHGRCLLRRPELAKIVADAIRHDDGVKFDLDRFVIMPNHVHALVQFRSGFTLSVVGQSWMRYTARRIRAVLQESGAFWEGEPFDHVVRSPEQFVWLRKYLADNPRKAKLRAGEYYYWSRDNDGKERQNNRQ